MEKQNVLNIMSVRLYFLLNYLVYKGMHHIIIICGQSGSKKVIEHTMCVLILSTTFG